MNKYIYFLKNLTLKKTPLTYSSNLINFKNKTNLKKVKKPRKFFLIFLVFLFNYNLSRTVLFVSKKHYYLNLNLNFLVNDLFFKNFFFEIKSVYLNK